MLSTTLNTRLEAVICSRGCKRDKETVFGGFFVIFFLEGGLGAGEITDKKISQFSGSKKNFRGVLGSVGNRDRCNGGGKGSSVR